jgi:hypothetical protein
MPVFRISSEPRQNTSTVHSTKNLLGVNDISENGFIKLDLK